MVFFFLVFVGGVPSGEWDECLFWLTNCGSATGRMAVVATTLPR